MIQSVTGTSHTSARHVPLRRCLYCRQSLPQGSKTEGLIRLVREESGYALDLSRKLGGRGAWLCRDCAASLAADDASNKAAEKQARRAFGVQVTEMRDLLRRVLAADPARLDNASGQVDGQMEGGADVR